MLLRTIFVLFLSTLAASQNATLAKVLAENNIPSRGLPSSAISQNITSFAVLNDSDRFVIGYYVEHGNSLDAPLWIRVFNKHSSRWQSLAFGTEVANDQQSTLCLGSVLAIKSLAGNLLVETHINPSASCTIIFSPQLKLRSLLWGWVIAKMDRDTVLVEHNQIHFAPTHPLELDLYEISTNRLTKLYPPAQDRIREDFMHDLEDNVTDDWCRQENAACNPEEFETYLEGDPIFNAGTSALAFTTVFNSLGYGPKAEQVVGDRKVIYIFRKTRVGWDYRQFWADRFPTPLADAVKAPALDTFFH